MTIPASVYIITHNAERTLHQTLESVRDFQDIVVVDSFSTDRTISLCQRPNVRLYQHPFDGFAHQKAYALSLCRFPWVLNIDADEALTPPVLEEIKSLMQQSVYTALSCGFREVFLGAVARKTTGYKVRFFLKEKGRYNVADTVHEKIHVEGPTLTSKGYLLHNSIESVAHFVDKINAYSSLRATSRTKPPSLFKLHTIFLATLFKGFFLRTCPFKGWRGVLFIYMTSFYSFLKEAKRHEESCLHDSR